MSTYARVWLWPDLALVQLSHFSEKKAFPNRGKTIYASILESREPLLRQLQLCH